MRERELGYARHCRWVISFYVVKKHAFIFQIYKRMVICIIFYLSKKIKKKTTPTYLISIIFTTTMNCSHTIKLKKTKKFQSKAAFQSNPWWSSLDSKLKRPELDWLWFVMVKMSKLTISSISSHLEPVTRRIIYTSKAITDHRYFTSLWKW